MHLIISCLLQLGQLNAAEPFEFVTFFLHDEHTAFSFDMLFSI
jgi:hypothetical protein